MTTINGNVEIELDSSTISDLLDELTTEMDYEEIASQVEEHLDYQRISENVEIDITDAVGDLLYRYRPERNDQCETIREANGAVERGMIYTLENSANFYKALTPIVLSIITENSEEINNSTNDSNGQENSQPTFTYDDVIRIIETVVLDIVITKESNNFIPCRNRLISLFPVDIRLKIQNEEKKNSIQ